MTNESIYYLSSIRNNTRKLSYFHFFTLLLRFIYETKCKYSYSRKAVSYNSEYLISENLKVASYVTKKKLSLRIFFSGNFQSNCFEKNISIWFYRTRFHYKHFLKYVSTFFRDSYFTKHSFEQLLVRNLYLLSQPNNYWCGRVVLVV